MPTPICELPWFWLSDALIIKLMLQRLLTIGLVGFASVASALYEVGDSIPNLCWWDDRDWQVCLGHNYGRVTVMIYNTGW